MNALVPSEDYRDIFHWGLGATLIIDPQGPEYLILEVNNAYLQATQTTRESLLGKSVFSVFPSNPTDQVSRNIELTINSFQEAITSKKPHTMRNYRYDIPKTGTDQFIQRYWTTTNIPVMDPQGNVKFLIHSPVDVTDHYLLEEREKAGIEALKNQREQLYSVFMQAPVAIGIFEGPQYIVNLVNPSLCELYGKTIEEMLGKPIFDVLAHARDKGYEELLDRVRLTGIPYIGQSAEVPLLRDGKLEVAYVDFVYEPFRKDDGDISGVIVVALEVTENVKAKLLLEEAEERARLAIDSVGLGTFDLNLVSGETITSVTLARIFGFQSPVAWNEYMQVFHPDDLEIRNQAFNKAVVSGKLYYEARIIWPDGSIRWIRAEGKIYSNNENGPIRMVGTILDFTEQKALKEDQQKLIALVTNSVDLMAVFNLDGSTAYINDYGKDLLGFEHADQVKTIFLEQLHGPEDYDLLQNEIMPKVMEQGHWSGVIKVRHLKTAELLPVYLNMVGINDANSDHLIAIGAVMRDLRPELKAKQALEESEALLRSITTAAPTGLWQSNEKGEIIYINDTWIKWTGIPVEEQCGAGWLNCVLPDDREEARRKYNQALKLKALYEAEFRILHTDGNVHWCIADGRPQYSPEGVFTGYIGACVDMTEQKYLQQQKDNFIGIASHELKTPVTSLKAYAQVLEKMLLKKGDIREAGMIAKMDGQLNRLTNLIGDLLDVTKINSGRLQFNDREFDFNELVKDLIEDLQRTTTKHTFISKLQPTRMVFGDKERIGQVIINLVTNALKYSPEADKIHITSVTSEDKVTFCVQDFGIGIASAHKDKVFEQFYRVSGDKQHTFPGLGLGLYISAEIIKREGGKIWVDSEINKGSTFCFSLPLKI